jgi:hypothetical protein
MNTFAFLNLSAPDLVMFVSLIVAVVVLVAAVKLGSKVYKSFLQGYTSKGKKL